MDVAETRLDGVITQMNTTGTYITVKTSNPTRETICTEDRSAPKNTNCKITKTIPLT
jgi:hypothetical protein